MNETFAKWLQAELDRRGLSARELALEMRSSPATVYRVLNGERGVGREVAAPVVTLRAPVLA